VGDGEPRVTYWRGWIRNGGGGLASRGAWLVWITNSTVCTMKGAGQGGKETLSLW
jgi:hypothetical protein